MTRRYMSPDQKLAFEAREDYIADRSTKEARRQSFAQDEHTRIFGSGWRGDAVRLDVPAVTTQDLKQASKTIRELALNLKELSESTHYKSNHKIMLFRQAVTNANSDLRERKKRSYVNYKKP